MRVRATKTGFYIKLRDPGDQFDIPQERFSARWMEEIVKKPPVKPRKKRAKKALKKT